MTRRTALASSHPLPIALSIALALALVAAAPPARAEEPPDRLNYEGVLRGPDDAPVTGLFDMVFRFYDVESGGSALLIDAHLAAGSGAVVVEGGLFNVALGGGDVSDGPGPGTIVSLSDLFGDAQEVWMELAVAGETLAPRVEVRAAAYALNADRVDGLESTDFLRSNTGDTFAGGTLTVETTATLDVQGTLRVDGGGTAAAGRLLTSDAAGNATWQDPPAGASPLLLPEIADRLGVDDPSAQPFAALRPLDCSGGPATLELELDGVPFGEAIGFVGRDAISEVPSYRVAVRLPETTTEPVDLVGDLGRLSLTRAGQTTTWSGDVVEAALAAAAPDGEAIYVIELRPSIDRLARSTGYRIHQNRSVPQTLSSVLGDAGISNVSTPLTGTYVPRTSTVQWKESELDFVRRILAEAGIHLHVEESGSRETLVFSDDNAGFPSIGTLDYPGDGQEPGGGQEFVATFGTADRARPATTRVRGYNFENPAFDPVATASAGGLAGVAYAFEDVVDSGEASIRATLAAERERTAAALHRGSGNAAALKAGHRFLLDDLTASGALSDEYVVTAIEHFADAGGTCIEYGNTFHALPSAVPYRPPLATPKPRVEGPVLAEVAGPSAAGYHIDEYGRIKVRFLWDRDNPADESASAWIRVAAPPGKQDKDLWLPRVGSEVLVDFVDGDPDRPVVVGSLSNEEDLPIFALPDAAGSDFLRGGTYVDGALYLSDPRSTIGPLGKGITEQLVFWDATFSWEPNVSGVPDSPFESAFVTDDALIVGGDLRIDQALEFSGGGAPGALAWDGTEFALSDGLSVTGPVDFTGPLSTGGPLDIGNLELDSFGLTSTSNLSVDAANSLQLSGVTASLAGQTNTLLSAGGEIDLTSTILDVNASVAQFDGQVVVGGPLSAQTTLNVTQSATIGTDLAVNGGDITSPAGLRLHATSRIDYSDSSVYTFIDNDANQTNAFHAWYRDGLPFATNQIAELQEDGDLRIRGTISQNVAFDVAESFLVREPLQPGEVVRLDPARPGGVLRTREAGDPLAIGVVSTNPGVVLGGVPFDVEELRRAWGGDVVARFEAERPELRERLLARRPDLTAALERAGDRDATLQAESAVESACLEEFHARVTAPIALSGRVPVRADAAFGPIRPGDALTPSPVPGVAMRLDGEGPSIGTALEGLDSGRGLVLTLVDRDRRGALADGMPADDAPVAPRPVDPGLQSAVGETPGAGDIVEVAAHPTLPTAPWTVTRPAASVATATGGATADGDADGEPVMRLDAEGNLHLRGALQPDAMDLAEVFRLADDATAQPGDLLVVDPASPGRYRPGARAGDPAVVGIVSERPGVLLGAGIERILASAPDALTARWREARLARDVEAEEAVWAEMVERFRATHAPIALSGTVPCKVDAGYGAIRPGDLLTTSPTAGHAMRASDPAPGTVVGKALEPLADGTGVIRVLVLMR